MNIKKIQEVMDYAGLMFGPNCPFGFTDAQINRATGAWKRAQQQIGIPRSPETRQKISAALTGRRLSAATKAKISQSLKARHQAKANGVLK